MNTETVQEIRELLVTSDAMTFSEKQIDVLTRYAELVLVTNEQMNLTAITDAKGFYSKHIIDSLTLLPYVGVGPMRLIDVGSGAGFPGIPLKIMRPDLTVVLLDSLQKRVRFLNETVTALGLEGITAIHARAEEAARNPVYREGFDLVTARAVAPLPVLLELCLPLAKAQGRFLAMKGPTEDVESAGRALEVLGGKLLGMKVAALPFGQGERVILEIKKTKKTPAAYPRKAGTPGKKPLM